MGEVVPFQFFGRRKGTTVTDSAAVGSSRILEIVYEIAASAGSPSDIAYHRVQPALVSTGPLHQMRRVDGHLLAADLGTTRSKTKVSRLFERDERSPRRRTEVGLKTVHPPLQISFPIWIRRKVPKDPLHGFGVRTGCAKPKQRVSEVGRVVDQNALGFGAVPPGSTDLLVVRFDG